MLRRLRGRLHGVIGEVGRTVSRRVGVGVSGVSGWARGESAVVWLGVGSGIGGRVGGGISRGICDKFLKKNMLWANRSSYLLVGDLVGERFLILGDLVGG